MIEDQTKLSPGKPDKKSAILSTISEFTDRLYKNSNVIISPLSLYMCIGMLANGAKAQTKTELEELLKIPVKNLNEMFKEYINETKEKINIANSIWIEDSFSKISEEFKMKIKEIYDGDINKVPMDAKTLKEINSWVNNKTRGMIPSILNELSSDTIAILINTLYFNELWVTPYERESIGKAMFYGLGNNKDVDIMLSSECTYYENDKATAFSKPYKNGYSFIGILPKEEGDFNAKDLNLESLLDSETYKYKVYAAIPKFDFEYSTSLVETMQNMGVKRLFKKTANLSGILEKGSVYISEIIQKNKIEVSEKGVTAAAATSAEIMIGAVKRDDPSETKTIILNRPFAFLIMDENTDIPLFVGKIIDF